MRVVRRLLVIVLALVVLVGGWSAYLWRTSPEPRSRDAWRRLAELPRPRGEVASGVAARIEDDAPLSTERFFVVGGIAGPGRTVAWVDVYDPTENVWRTGPDLPEPRHHAAAAGTGGVLYVTGGSRATTDWTPTPTLWLLRPTDTQWQRGPDMPEGRMGHQMVAVGPTLYVVGGRGRTSNVLAYDTTTRRWRTGAQMPVPRDHLGAAVAGTSIYAIGGRDDALLPRVDVYDTATDAWSTGPPLPIPMSAMAVGTTFDPDEGIHVVGGEDPASIGGGVIDRHFVLPLGGDRWEEREPPVIATHGAASGVIVGQLYIAGGAARHGALSPLAWRGVTQRYEGE